MEHACKKPPVSLSRSPSYGAAACLTLSLFGQAQIRRRDATSVATSSAFEHLFESVACGSPLRRAYRPQRRRGRVAEGGGLLNRYRVVKPYRGFESLRLRQYVKIFRRFSPDCPSLPTNLPTAWAANRLRRRSTVPKKRDFPSHEAIPKHGGPNLSIDQQRGPTMFALMLNAIYRQFLRSSLAGMTPLGARR